MSRLAGAEYPRWVLAITVVATLGYALSVAIALLTGGTELFPNLWSEVLALAAAFGSLLMTRRYPTRAAAVALFAVWGELQFGFYTSAYPYAIGVVAGPLLVAGAGLLLGERWSLAFAVCSSALAPVLIARSPAFESLSLSDVPDVERFYALHAIVNLGVWVVVTTGLRAFGRSFVKLEASERRLANTIRLAPDGIILLEGGGEVAAVNPAAARILGVEAVSWPRRPIAALLAAAGADAETRAALRGGRLDGLPLAFTLHQVGRGAVHVEVTSQETEDGGEQWMLRDVTGRVREEASRRAMELQLAHVQRMEAVGQLAGGIAHDFNNLLTAIGASAEMLKAEAAADDDHSLVDEILAAQERGRTLTRQLLSFARRDLAQARVFDLAAQVHELERLVARVAGERVRFSFTFAGDCRVRADVGQVEQALVNLVSNAKDAMPEGGACRVSVQRVTGADGTDWVALVVADTGLGMDEETKRHAFEPFFTTKPRGKGTGLGLASVHGIVMASNGRARIESVPGLGTTVTLEFPAVDAPVEVPHVPEAVQSAAHAQATVLVAEDDEAIRSAVRRILTRAGYSVVVAPDGLEAARIAEARGTPFDLVLTDVIMPSLTGPQLVGRLRRRWPGLAALFMSGYPEDALAEVPNFSVQRDFLAKPFKPSDLERRVAEALAGRKVEASA
ncbi:MAG: response regulator [Gemmatimonadota bacterium]|nr:response regulator [Gemmatimonadota bacterium]